MKLASIMRRGHDYLAQVTELYKTCKDCDKRTPHVCTRCGFCYSCHWKVERPPTQMRLVATA